MIQYNRISSYGMDLYFKNIHIQPNTEYILSFDIYGGLLNVFTSANGVLATTQSHYVGNCREWKHYDISFTSKSDDVTLFYDWGISFVKKSDEYTDMEDTYIDNVTLVPRDGSTPSLIVGGDFEAAKNSSVYNRHWHPEILGLPGTLYGVDIVPDPTGRRNRCLKLPKPLYHHHRLPSPLPLAVHYFGRFENSEKNITVINPYTNNAHHFILPVNGIATLQIGDYTRTLTAGTLTHLPPSTPYHCTFRGGQHTNYYRLEFGGEHAAPLLLQLGIADNVTLPLSDVGAVTAQIDKMLAADSNSFTYLYVLSSYLHRLLATLEQQLSPTPKVGKHENFINSIAATLREHPETLLNIKQMARMCDMSESYFITLFKKQFGVTPHQYRLRELTNKACALLQDTNMTVQEISYTLGIDDPLYFSRLFRKMQGISPRNYRRHRDMK